MGAATSKSPASLSELDAHGSAVRVFEVLCTCSSAKWKSPLPVGRLACQHSPRILFRRCQTFFTKAKRSAVMAAIRGRGNQATELRMVALMRLHGITGWRRHVALRVVGTSRTEKEKRKRVQVDFVFRRERVAIFVDGCFWHACPRHGTRPAGNRAFWNAKLDRNVARDRAMSRALRKDGWSVLRVWEHDLALKNWPRVARRLSRALGRECGGCD